MKQGYCNEVDLENVLKKDETGHEEALIEAETTGQPLPSIRNLNNDILIKKRKKLNNYCEINVTQYNPGDKSDDHDDYPGSSNRTWETKSYTYYAPNQKSSYNSNQVKNAHNQARSRPAHVMDLPNNNYFKKKFVGTLSLFDQVKL